MKSYRLVCSVNRQLLTYQSNLKKNLILSNRICTLALMSHYYNFQTSLFLQFNEIDKYQFAYRIFNILAYQEFDFSYE